MGVVINLIISIFAGIAGALFSVHCSKRSFVFKKKKNKPQTYEQINTIGEEHIQQCLYNPNKGRSIELVRKTIVDNSITPRFIVDCSMTITEKQ